MWAAYHHYRTLTAISTGLWLTLQSRRDAHPTYRSTLPSRPAEADRLTLLQHPCSLAMTALVGTLHEAQHRRCLRALRSESAAASLSPPHGAEPLGAVYSARRPRAHRSHPPRAPSPAPRAGTAGTRWPATGRRLYRVVGSPRRPVDPRTEVPSRVNSNPGRGVPRRREGRAPLAVPVGRILSTGHHSSRPAVAASRPTSPHQSPGAYPPLTGLDGHGFPGAGRIGRRRRGAWVAQVLTHEPPRPKAVRP